MGGLDYKIVAHKIHANRLPCIIVKVILNCTVSNYYSGAVPTSKFFTIFQIMDPIFGRCGQKDFEISSTIFYIQILIRILFHLIS